MAAFPVLFDTFFQSSKKRIFRYSQSAKIDVFYRADFVHYRKKAAKQHVYIIKNMNCFSVNKFLLTKLILTV